jgi:hypothetical protein
MPPPTATTESPRDRQVRHEMGQIVRALEDIAKPLTAADAETDAPSGGPRAETAHA